jgi:hypothetical protein
MMRLGYGLKAVVIERTPILISEDNETLWTCQPLIQCETSC